MTDTAKANGAGHDEHAAGATTPIRPRILVFFDYA